jgi:hypothetical protein
MNEKLLIGPIPERFTCPICLSLLEDPVEHTACDSIFCRKCLNYNISCPICRGRIGSTSIKALNRHLKTDFDNLSIKCGNAVNGCESVCTIGTFQTHLKTCLFAGVECGIPGCAEFMLRKNLEIHRSRCPFRLVRCEHCRTQVKAGELARHFETCPEFPVSCKFCSLTYQRSKEAAHYIECAKYPCRCTLCPIVVSRENLIHHNRHECAKRPTKCSFCSEIMSLDILDHHVKSCPSVPMQCEHCSEMFTRRLANIHFAKCPEVLFACSECQHNVARKDCEKHQTEGCSQVFTRCAHCEKIVQVSHHKFCPSEKLSCRFCSESVKRGALADHLDVCPKRIITCPVPGCRRKCKREELDNHWAEVSSQHIRCLLQKIQIPIVTKQIVKVSALSLHAHPFKFTQLPGKAIQVEMLNLKMGNMAISEEKRELDKEYTELVTKNNRQYGKLNGIWYDCEFGCPLKRCNNCSYIRPDNNMYRFTEGFTDSSFDIHKTFTCIRCSREYDDFDYDYDFDYP